MTRLSDASNVSETIEEEGEFFEDSNHDAGKLYGLA